MRTTALDPILAAAQQTLGQQTNTKVLVSSQINFAGLLPSNTQGWFYEGSLTTPPLSQPVNWFVFATPITLDSAQLKEYEQVAGPEGFLPNARPSQPLDGRILNEINYDVAFNNTSVAGLNFRLSRPSKMA